MSPIGRYELLLGTALLTLATTAMWIRHGGLDQLDRVDGWFIGLGQLTSLYATLALLATMLLVARVPWIERAIGLDLLNHWHRSAAIVATVLIGLHLVGSTLGYAIDAETGVVAQFGVFLTDWPDMITATVGTVVFLLVGLTSARFARRMARYEIWWLVHLTGYIALVLPYFHETSTGFDFFDDAVARAFWITMHLAVGVALVAFRLGTPVTRALRHRLRIDEVRMETDDTATITVRGHDLDRLRVAGGQFFLLRFLTRDRWWKAHPYSLSAAPDGESLRFTIKALGDDSAAALRLPVGTRIVAEGPYGHVSAALATREKVVLIGGGIGITPIRAIFEDLDRPPGTVDVLYRTRRRDDAPLLDELRELADVRGHRLVVSYSREPGEEDPHPFAPDRLLERFPDLGERDVFLCGPPGVIAGALDGLHAAGVPAGRIHRERFVY